MTGTITLSTDLVNERVGVTLGAWAAADGPITVWRVHQDTTEWPVRGITATSGGAAFAWDYEAPFNEPVTYNAFDGSTRVQSAPATLSILYPLLRGPGLPANDATFELIAKPPTKRPRPQTSMAPWGRPRVVVLSGDRTAGEFTLQLETHSVAEARQLIATLTLSDVCLLLTPGTRDAWQYISVGDLDETPFDDMLRIGEGTSATWSQWSMPCVVVDPPVGGIYGDPTASYQVMRDTYATYAALKAAKPTYLDVLRGV